MYAVGVRLYVAGGVTGVQGGALVVLGGVVRTGGVGVEEQQAEGEQEYEFGAGILHVWRRQLKLFRERAGMDRAELGALTGYSAATIASFEQEADSTAEVHRPGG